MTTISSENLTLVTVVTFLSMFALLTMALGSSGILSGATGQQSQIVKVPDYFEGVDLTQYAVIYIQNFSSGDCEYCPPNTETGGWNFYIHKSDSKSFIRMNTHAVWWIFTWSEHWFWWYDYKGIDRTQPYALFNIPVLPYNALDTVYAEANGTKDSLRYTVKDEITITVYFGFNQTKYAKPSDALIAGEASMILGLNIDQVQTRINAWGLIGGILFFQAPEIHPVLNLIIAIPIWVMIAWLLYILILKAIPFVGG